MNGTETESLEATSDVGGPVETNNDVIMTDAGTPVDPHVAAPSVDGRLPQQHLQEQQHSPNQPSLSRMASAGDTQPLLAERQPSVGDRVEHGTPFPTFGSAYSTSRVPSLGAALAAPAIEPGDGDKLIDGPTAASSDLTQPPDTTNGVAPEDMPADAVMTTATPSHLVLTAEVPVMGEILPSAPPPGPAPSTPTPPVESTIMSNDSMVASISGGGIPPANSDSADATFTDGSQLMTSNGISDSPALPEGSPPVELAHAKLVAHSENPGTPFSVTGGTTIGVIGGHIPERPPPAPASITDMITTGLEIASSQALAPTATALGSVHPNRHVAVQGQNLGVASMGIASATMYPATYTPPSTTDTGNATRNEPPTPLQVPPVRAAGVVPPSGPMGGMKELRVEDALLYLDDVKREFGDRPRVYNEFLGIMKNFKSQEVDTPGVIARVSKLFRGYNNLILGFNKFLPDGYKISMQELEMQDAMYAREQEMLRAQQASMASKGGPAPMSIDGPGRAGPMGMMAHVHGLSTGSPPQHLQQQQQPLQMMSNVGPKPGLPGRASELFAGGALKGKTPEQKLPAVSHQQPRPPKQPGSGKGSAGKAGKGRKGPGSASSSQQAAPQPQTHHAVEFDHAISYVTTIKRRFQNDPSTYHSFLEILHTYQKEQRGIKDVLEQVAHLFQDHPDLLKEFTFFLPDAVQEQAKERLNRAAADSEARLAAQRSQKQQQDVEADPDGSKGGKRFIDMTGRPIAVDPDTRRKRPHKEVQETPIPIAFLHPETYVYNAAVERQFFDAAKEALASFTRDGGQAWAEFLKCLHMYAQEILSRPQMLNFLEDLLGKRNNKLFEEFKRILSAAEGQGTSTSPSMEDSWYSVPLSEIDFSRCRRCSPSYRALPRDYPAPPCSQRSDDEAKVLNDVWVSLPVGSEESYTFRHMRRNTYEEALFRVEDERFEIDMAIDSNLCTLALLEPFAEVMAQLSESELQTQVEKDNEPKPSLDGKGLGGKYFRYTFDKTIMGVIHRNSITRIYGDAGQEMLSLLERNPSVAIPIVVRRLLQKDVEWRRVRDRLNRHWRELAENNYYKSLDHRSLTWRTTDKRAISTRTLISEIKDRAANNGNEGLAALQARIDKAKEEHGTFYEVTMADSISRELDLATLPKPDRRLFTPHMSFMYENTTWVQRDVYRILSFALERGTISPTDKERCHRLWTEFLGPWFNLSLNWMLSPAVAFQETSTLVSRKDIARIGSHDDNSPAEDEEESMDEDGEINARIVTEDVRDHEHDEKSDSPCYNDHHPLPAGSTVSTIYGDGRVIKCRREDDMYVVKLAFGTAYLRPSAVLCSILGAEKSAYTTQRRKCDRTKLDRPDDMLVIGNQSLFLFFRLHQILCRRLGIARRLSYEVKNDSSLQTMVDQMSGEDSATLGRRRYDAFLTLVFALLDGGTGSAAEGGKYEDRVRTLLGHGGYELATMDKLISHILKNIQSMANDDTMWSLVQLFRRHLDAGGFKPEAFRQEAAYLSDGEQMYAFQYCPVHKDGGDKSVLYMEYLGVISGSAEEDISPPAAVGEPAVKRVKR